MTTLLIAVGAFVGYLVAYHTYGRWLSQKIFNLDPEAEVPSHQLRDNVDFVPTKKEVISGLSPQLLVEAIILSEGGFAIESEKVHKLIYVKINSSQPYIKITEITLEQGDLLKHKHGLISLLEHYVNTRNFVVEPNLMRYDDYSHLARRL